MPDLDTAERESASRLSRMHEAAARLEEQKSSWTEQTHVQALRKVPAATAGDRTRWAVAGPSSLLRPSAAALRLSAPPSCSRPPTAGMLGGRARGAEVALALESAVVRAEAPSACRWREDDAPAASISFAREPRRGAYSEAAQRDGRCEPGVRCDGVVLARRPVRVSRTRTTRRVSDTCGTSYMLHAQQIMHNNI